MGTTEVATCMRCLDRAWNRGSRRSTKSILTDTEKAGEADAPSGFYALSGFRGVWATPLYPSHRAERNANDAARSWAASSVDENLKSRAT